MKTGIILLLCAPLIGYSAQNRFGQTQPPAGGGPNAQVCTGQGPGGQVCTGQGAGSQLCAGQGYRGQARMGQGPGSQACPRAADCPLVTTAITSPSTLPAGEIVSALEEERVAHDLYLAAAERWNLKVFTNIAVAETRHAAAVTQLATASAISLPPAARGVYATPDMQALYTGLLAIVNESETGALRAGALVEETDIADLRRSIAAATDAGTRTIFSNLERASTNHLRAFVRNLAARGITYEPKVLSPDEYKALLGG